MRRDKYIYSVADVIDQLHLSISCFQCRTSGSTSKMWMCALSLHCCVPLTVCAFWYTARALCTYTLFSYFVVRDSDNVIFIKQGTIYFFYLHSRTGISSISPPKRNCCRTGIELIMECVQLISSTMTGQEMHFVFIAQVFGCRAIMSTTFISLVYIIVSIKEISDNFTAILIYRLFF